MTALDSSPPPAQAPLTFTEFQTCLEDAFITPPASNADLINTALRCHARPAVFAGISLLPERTFDSVHEAWSCLSHLGFGIHRREA
ncbi:DUF2795 domain-containing protein [Actinokineospora iranica]|uniref:Uncharacterized protein n=1 Tax=Actinokineospora iranica TaxID=1271860 RepID=A0A1G6UC00_9PSEU|nr:DUF2795 domain-containing protein [Actinokineospora iranica]SDD38833.1 hypothetical protein SAMN05216174_110201 [Actinokineospora iranica]